MMGNMEQAGLVRSEDGKWHDAEGRRIWRAGTLTYTRKQLARLFVLLGLGGFTFVLVVTGFPMMLPLLFKQRGLSSTNIAWLMGISYISGMVLGPIIGVWSDRLRTRWGRRRPFDLIATPVWFVGLLILPFAESFWLTNVAMLMIGVAGAANVVITFLYNDVIPGELMGRFYAAIRFIGFGGAVLFQFLLFPMFDANPVFVLLTFSLVAFVGEMTMMLLVREGKYPEPPPRKPLLAGAKSYLKDGLGSKYICLLWLTLGVVALGAPAGNFFTLFFKNDLAMTSKDIGFMMGLGSAVAMVVILPAGWVVDKFGPNRTWGIMAFLVGLLQVMMYFFALDKISCTIIYLCYYGVNMVLAAALMPMLFSHLPKEKFGQLASFQSLLMQGVMFSSSMVLGAILSALGDAYRFVFLYAGVFYLFTPVFLVLMTRGKNPFAHMEFSMKATHGVKKEK